jgi:hypothetical protein
MKIPKTKRVTFDLPALLTQPAILYETPKVIKKANATAAKHVMMIGKHLQSIEKRCDKLRKQYRRKGSPLPSDQEGAAPKRNKALRAAKLMNGVWNALIGGPATRRPAKKAWFADPNRIMTRLNPLESEWRSTLRSSAQKDLIARNVNV